MSYVSAVTGESATEPVVCSCGCVTRRESIDADAHRLVAVHCDRCGVVGWRWSVGLAGAMSRLREEAA